MRIGCIVDLSVPHAATAFTSLSKLYALTKIDESSPIVAADFDVILTIGGDGMMLRALHCCMYQQIPVFGMNKGSLGFLLNKYSEVNLIERIKNAQICTLFPLEVHIKAVDGSKHFLLAINEVSLLRQNNQSAKIKVSVNNDVQLDHLIGDGILVATPSGSTAYNYAVGGPIIPISANVLAMSPISPFRPRQWRGALILRSDIVRLEVLEHEKRPVSASADFNEIKDVLSIEAKESNQFKLSVLFDPEDVLAKRALKEQFT